MTTKTNRFRAAQIASALFAVNQASHAGIPVQAAHAGIPVFEVASPVQAGLVLGLVAGVGLIVLGYSIRRLRRGSRTDSASAARSHGVSNKTGKAGLEDVGSPR